MDYYLGIDFGGTQTKIGIIDARGKLQIRASFPTDIARSGPEIVSAISRSAEKLIENSEISKSAIRGIGIGSPGQLDPEKGTLISVANVPQLNRIDFAPRIGDYLQRPAFLDNDVNAMALGEFLYGAGQGYRNIVALTLGTGVGGAIILNGELYHGATFTAGEIGHFSIDPDGLYCPCGNYGCLERYVGREGIVNRFQMYRSKGLATKMEHYLDNGQITPRAIAQAAGDNDELAREVMAETGKILGIALASLANILNPEIFIIGGGIANAGNLLLEPARRELTKRALTVPGRKVKVLPATLKNDAGIVGAASIAVAKLAK